MRRLRLILLAGAFLMVSCGPMSAGLNTPPSRPSSTDEGPSAPTTFPAPDSILSTPPSLDFDPDEPERYSPNTPYVPMYTPGVPEPNAKSTPGERNDYEPPFLPAPPELEPKATPLPQPETTPIPLSTPHPDTPPATPQMTPAPETDALPLPSPTPVTDQTDPPTHPKAPAKKKEPEPHKINVPPGSGEKTPSETFLSCETMDQTTCPSGVGLLVSSGVSSLAQCTGFLVSDRLMLTNSHCIPEDLRAAGSECQHRIRVFFPATQDNGAERAFCDKVIHASVIGSEGQKKFGLAPDYALIQLSAPVSRRPMAVSREGLPDGLRVWAYVIEPHPDQQMGGLLKVKTCTAKHGSVTAPSFTQKYAGVGSFSGCTIVPGNSGSPAIDEQGRVRALIHATIPASKPKSPGSPGFHPMGLATNLACTELPQEAMSGAGTPRDECAQSRSSSDLVREAYTKSDDRELEALGQEWLKSAPKALKFTIQRSESKQSPIHLLAPQIHCVQEPKKWLEKSTATRATLKFAQPFWGFMISLDQDYRVVLKPGVVEIMNQVAELDTVELAKKGWTRGRLERTSRNSGKTDSLDQFAFALCRD